MPGRSSWVLLVSTSELTGLLCLRMPVENIATVHAMDDELVACYALLVFWQPDDKKAVKKKRDCVFECQ